eukprot:NODE_3331_length_943_cov_11.073826_g2775_i0.p1 GENE.NODE_3331_length_943_cov_11.073826_g2775_i0~~NODE_3331_length_943_cov_11.073826_g2775_i0.p1  ORF type:complete len:222 (+),score=51.08 NODE_3331_length_943_cov_11.073826_g2775_i0:140-805(+)
MATVAADVEVDHAALLSQMLGYIIIAGSAVLKIPQILKMLRAKSAEGVLLSTFLSELVGFTVAATYGFSSELPFSTYGESAIICFQNLVIIYLIIYYNEEPIQKFLLLFSIWAGYVGLAVAGVIPGYWLSFLTVALQIPVILSSRLTQIADTYRRGRTGQLSFLTSLMNFAGTMSRVFTTIKSAGGDPIMLAANTLSFLLNGAILVQFAMYWNAKPEKKQQ